MRKLRYVKSICLCSLLLMAFYSCGDIFAKRIHIVGSYYLVEEEGYSDYSMAYRLKYGDYIGRVPPSVVEYGWTDSILVVKTKLDAKNSIYIINMKRDFELADEADYLIEILNDEEFNSKWQKKVKIVFKKV